MYACDPKWWAWHAEDKELKDFKGKKYTQDKDSSDKYRIKYIESQNNEGLSISPNVIHQGQNSGYQAINLAYHLGARKVILLGFDMQLTEGKSHWFGDHPDKIRSGYAGFIKQFNRLAINIKDMDLEIINCTNVTALTCFTRKPLKEVL